MRKETIILFSLGIIVLLGIFFWLQYNQPVVLDKKPAINEGIQIDTPKANEVVSSPLKIRGIVNGNDDWIGFEGQVGTVVLLDGKGNELSVGILTTTTEWTQLPVSFEANLIFLSSKDDIGSLIFHNEDPSGEPEKYKTFVLPIKFK